MLASISRNVSLGFSRIVSLSFIAQLTMVINQIRSLSVRPWENKAVFKQCKYAGRLPTWSYELVMGREVGSKEQCQLTQSTRSFGHCSSRPGRNSSRSSECRGWQYFSVPLTALVVICFHLKALFCVLCLPFYVMLDGLQYISSTSLIKFVVFPVLYYTLHVSSRQMLLNACLKSVKRCLML